jgi:hypothetical protein
MQTLRNCSSSDNFVHTKLHTQPITTDPDWLTIDISILAEQPQNPQFITITTSIDHNIAPYAMASLTSTSRTLLRALPRSSLVSMPIRALSTSSSKSRASEASATSSFDSPFRGGASDKGSKIPDFSHYRSKSGTNSNLVFQYFMVGRLPPRIALERSKIVVSAKC